MNRRQKITNFLLGVSLVGILFEVIRSCMRKGDFVGYINAGHLTLNGQNIYSDYLNTWPPFFSIFSVPLALLDNINGIALRVVWLLLSVWAMFVIMKMTIRWFYKLELKLPFQKVGSNEISFTDARVFFPYLILLRYILDNLSNVQINIFMLLMSVVVIDLFRTKKYLLAGSLLAFSISLKVYTVFLLFFFLYKRAFPLVAWTFAFLFFFNILPLLVYGVDQGMAYYVHWWNDIASPFATIQHKNQSFFSMMRSLLMRESPGLGIYVNVADLSVEVAKKVSYVILLLGALYPAWLFRKRSMPKHNHQSLLEYAFILAAIPILSPLAWKAYFIFLWPAYLLIYYYCYCYKGRIKKQTLSVLKGLYIVSILLTVFSTDTFVGPYLSDVLESYSCITIGTILVLIQILIIYNQLDLKAREKLTI